MLGKKERLAKELIYKSCHRGCKETDLLLCNFAETYVAKMSEFELLDYKEIISQNDLDLYEWLLDKAPPPSNINSHLINQIKTHHAKPTT